MRLIVRCHRHRLLKLQDRLCVVLRMLLQLHWHRLHRRHLRLDLRRYRMGNECEGGLWVVRLGIGAIERARAHLGVRLHRRRNGVLLEDRRAATLLVIYDLRLLRLLRLLLRRQRLRLRRLLLLGRRLLLVVLLRRLRHVWRELLVLRLVHGGGGDHELHV